MANVYRTILDNILTGLAEQKPEQAIVEEFKNQRDVTTVYRKYGSVMLMLDWLEEKAEAEDAGYKGEILMSEGGGNG